MALQFKIPPDYQERIARLRAQLGLTRTRLEEMLGVSTGTVGLWESGQLEPSLPIWTRIAAAEERGVYALMHPEPSMLSVAEVTDHQGKPPALDLLSDPKFRVLQKAEVERVATEPGGEKLLMTTTSEASEHSRHPLLGLVDRWRSEPGDYDERVGEVLDLELCEPRLSLREPEILSEEDEV